MKLLPGDQLEVIAADSFLTTRGFGNGAKVTFRAFDGEYIDLADMPYAQGTGPHRFAFVSRPSPPVVHGWPDREAVKMAVANACLEYAPLDRSQKFSERVRSLGEISEGYTQDILALFPPVVGRRGIETAPKDGRLMWLGRPYSLRVGFWATGEKYEHKGSGGGGWRDFNEGRDLAFEPTHWLPVPDAPPSLPAAPLTDNQEPKT